MVNQQLLSDLIRAKQFLEKDSYNRAQIKRHEEIIAQLPFEPDRKHRIRARLPEKPEKCIGCFEAFVLVAALNIIGAVIVFFKYRKDFNNEVEHKKECERITNEIRSSPEYLRDKEECEKQMEQEKILLQQAINEQRSYYNANYQKCLGFMSAGYRNQEDVNQLIRYVETGSAQTIVLAEDMLHAYYTRIHLMEAADEANEIAREQNKKTQDALDKITQNQEAIKDQLSRVNQNK